MMMEEGDDYAKASPPPPDDGGNNDDLTGDDRKPAADTRRRSGRKKPSDMPSRPLSAYNCFFREERMRLLAERKEAAEKLRSPSARPAQHQDGGGQQLQQQQLSSRSTGTNLFSAMGKIIAKRWKEQTPQQLERYVAMSKRDMLRYRTEMAEYQMERARKTRAATEELERQYHNQGRQEQEAKQQHLKQQLQQLKQYQYEQPAMSAARELPLAGSATTSGLTDTSSSSSAPLQLAEQVLPQLPSATMPHQESQAASIGGLLGGTPSLGSTGTPLPLNFAQRQQQSDIVAALSSSSFSPFAPMPKLEEGLTQVKDARTATSGAPQQGGGYEDGKVGQHPAAAAAGWTTTTTGGVPMTDYSSPSALPLPGKATMGSVQQPNVGGHDGDAVPPAVRLAGGGVVVSQDGIVDHPTLLEALISRNQGLSPLQQQQQLLLQQQYRNALGSSLPTTATTTAQPLLNQALLHQEQQQAQLFPKLQEEQHEAEQHQHDQQQLLLLHQQQQYRQQELLRPLQEKKQQEELHQQMANAAQVVAGVLPQQEEQQEQSNWSASVVVDPLPPARNVRDGSSPAPGDSST